MVLPYTLFITSNGHKKITPQRTKRYITITYNVNPVIAFKFKIPMYCRICKVLFYFKKKTQTKIIFQFQCLIITMHTCISNF